MSIGSTSGEPPKRNGFGHSKLRPPDKSPELCPEFPGRSLTTAFPAKNCLNQAEAPPARVTQEGLRGFRQGGWLLVAERLNGVLPCGLRGGQSSGDESDEHDDAHDDGD